MDGDLEYLHSTSRNQGLVSATCTWGTRDGIWYSHEDDGVKEGEERPSGWEAFF